MLSPSLLFLRENEMMYDEMNVGEALAHAEPVNNHKWAIRAHRTWTMIDYELDPEIIAVWERDGADLMLTNGIEMTLSDRRGTVARWTGETIHDAMCKAFTTQFMNVTAAQLMGLQPEWIPVHRLKLQVVGSDCWIGSGDPLRLVRDEAIAFNASMLSDLCDDILAKRIRNNSSVRFFPSGSGGFLLPASRSVNSSRWISGPALTDLAKQITAAVK